MFLNLEEYLGCSNLKNAKSHLSDSPVKSCNTYTRKNRRSSKTKLHMPVDFFGKRGAYKPFWVFDAHGHEEQHQSISLPPWRNWLARSAVNRKVGGSSPPGGGSCLFDVSRANTEFESCSSRFRDDEYGEDLTLGRQAFYHFVFQYIGFLSKYLIFVTVTRT